MFAFARLVFAQWLCVVFVALAVPACAGTGDEPPPASADDYRAWLAADAARANDVRDFEGFLARQGVAGIFPTYQLLRSESLWQACNGQPFTLAPKSEWPHIVGTLKFIRDYVEPKTGKLDVVSGYRDPALNHCAGGAAHSAHTGFWALDLEPVGAITRAEMIADVCRVHGAHGGAAHIGLGLYQARRFHIDSKGFRRWGEDYHAGTSPCAGVTS